MKPTASIAQIEQGHLRVVFGGELVLKYQSELKSIFTGLNDRSEPLEIQLLKPEGIDLCFLQMLEAFRREKKRANRKVTVSATLEEENADLLKRTGLLHLLLADEPLNTDTI
ncbi:hypothetical protein [Chryseolinea lacunae]|uniref:STAS domain-containing protein n=1 Tax=Chryseolinea lacunae TaxID=2801331 RepID=A0ABS1KMP9_9BACT|nr:hypothetical protein [Chryseolinea lacunae]MBL0740614.1 hypothetical protein [Chryseolinea lacunae]